MAGAAPDGGDDVQRRDDRVEDGRHCPEQHNIPALLNSEMQGVRDHCYYYSHLLTICITHQEQEVEEVGRHQEHCAGTETERYSDGIDIIRLDQACTKHISQL